ncbi:hypothetical protein N9J07_06450, partial [Bacteroidia bacterium]|nr:hypothetical protein [Bacteroidia bacterium]
SPFACSGAAGAAAVSVLATGAGVGAMAAGAGAVTAAGAATTAVPDGRFLLILILKSFFSIETSSTLEDEMNFISV